MADADYSAPVARQSSSELGGPCLLSGRVWDCVFSVGPLQQQAELSLDTLFGATAILALAMSEVSLVIAKHEEISASGFAVKTSSDRLLLLIIRRN